MLRGNVPYPKYGPAYHLFLSRRSIKRSFTSIVTENTFLLGQYSLLDRYLMGLFYKSFANIVYVNGTLCLGIPFVFNQF